MVSSAALAAVAAALALWVAAAGPLLAPAAADGLPPAEALTYIPHGFVHREPSAELREETLEQMQHYGIGQMLLPVHSFEKGGSLKLSRAEARALPAWVAATAAYDGAHGTQIAAVASIAGKVEGRSLELEEPAVRANMVAGVERLLAIGVGGVSLDLEPYPTSHGFVLLLEELDAALARHGFAGRLAVTAPASSGRWSQQELAEVTPLVDQVDPLFYDSERKTAAAYEQWVREGLAYYSAHTAAGTRIVPDLPSYGPDKWHEVSIENVATATSAVEEALREGSRVNGAGIFWWWGFYYDEEGAYNGAGDREAWLTRTLSAPFTP